MLALIHNRSTLFKIAVVTISIQLLRIVFCGTLLFVTYLGESARSALAQALLYAQPEMLFTLLATLLISVLFVGKEFQLRFLVITTTSVLAASIAGIGFVSNELANALAKALPFRVLSFLGSRGPSQVILCGVGFAFGSLMSIRLYAQVFPWMVVFGFAAMLGIGLGSLVVSMAKIVGSPLLSASIALSSLPFAFVCACLVVRYQKQLTRTALHGSPESQVAPPSPGEQ